MHLVGCQTSEVRARVRAQNIAAHKLLYDSGSQHNILSHLLDLSDHVCIQKASVVWQNRPLRISVVKFWLSTSAFARLMALSSFVFTEPGVFILLSKPAPSPLLKEQPDLDINKYTCGV